MENSSKQQQKKDWKKKGLGWIPDYPDLRDYNLGDEKVIKNNLRFKIEETTGNLEKLVEVVEDLINLISDSNFRNLISDSNSRKSLGQGQERIKEFKNKIFGNVLFAKVKVHKFLIKNENPETINDPYPSNPINYESILSNQIVKLKKYLGILVMRESIKSETNDVHFDDPIEVMEWMENSTYDQPTESLVLYFQRCSNILADGIVGLETYTTLNEYFSKNEKFSTLIEKPPIKSLSKIKFFPVTSLILKQEFEIILEDILKSKVIERIINEYLEYIQKNPDYQSNVGLLKRKIFEHDFLNNINIENKLLFEEIFNSKENDFLKENKVNFIFLKENNINIENELFEEILNFQGNDFLKDIISFIIFNCNNNTTISTKSQFSNIVTSLQNSSVTEPIFSVITRILSSLSHQSNNQSWEEMIKKAFEKFENIANQSSISNNSNTEPGYSEQELVISAINQVIYLIKLEISVFDKKDLEQKKEDENAKIEQEQEDKNAKFIYFLLKKYLNRCKCTLDAEDNIKEPKNINIFLDKKEVFEIELIFNYEPTPENNGDQQKESKELFPTLDLYIPIIISDSNIKKLSRFNQKKLFFYLPTVVDLSFWCSPVKDQGSLNSCTAFAAIALLEYFENRNFGQSTDASPLFLYKAARNKMKVEGDIGVSIRETIKVLALFGVPPEESWPYQEDKVDEEPPPYCYAYAQNYKTLKYFLLDYAGITTECLLFQVKAVLAAGFPCIFGLTLYTSAYEETNSKKGHIPFPDPNKDKVVGGHTAVVVGYDDYKFIRCADRKHYSRGAFLIRNSWGTEWGINGYGWLPYDYVLAGLTAAWWSLLKAEWFDESNFGSARTGGTSGCADTGGNC